MSIRRIVPNVPTHRLPESVEFYTHLFGFEVAMDLGWITTLASPELPTAQLSLVLSEVPPGDATFGALSISIEVGDVDAVHARAQERGLPLELALTDEPWGVRRFQLRDPSGVLLNVLSHQPKASSGD